MPGRSENTDTPWFVIYPLGIVLLLRAGRRKLQGRRLDRAQPGGFGGQGRQLHGGNRSGRRGRFHPTAISQLKEVGEWLKVNGAGIYATRGRDGELWSEGADLRFTRTKDNRTIYAFTLKWPGEKLLLRTVRPSEGSAIRMLGMREPLKWSLSSGRRWKCRSRPACRTNPGVLPLCLGLPDPPETV